MEKQTKYAQIWSLDLCSVSLQWVPYIPECLVALPILLSKSSKTETFMDWCSVFILWKSQTHLEGVICKEMCSHFTLKEF